MRCLIYAKSIDSIWLKDYLPDVEPYLLKIVNKPLLEYYVDLMSLLKVIEVRIVSDSSIKAIEAYFKDGAKWGLKISYALARPNDTLDSVYIKNYSFCKDSDMLLWDGFFFVQYDRDNAVQNFDYSQGLHCHGQNRRLVYLPQGTKLKDIDAHQTESTTCLLIREIHSVQDYFKLSMEILTQTNKSYVLPGYSNEKDTFLGLNFVFPHTSKVNPPIMIGNNCRLRKHTIAGPNSILGDNVIVDENSSICNSIIYDNTYIGDDLEFENKIVYKNHLICGLSGQAIQINEKGIISGVDVGIVISLFNRLVQRFIALLFILIQIVPWIVLYLPYSLFVKDLKRDHIINKSLKTERYDDEVKLCGSVWGRLMLRLCLDKSILLWSVVFGKIYLVGNRLFPNTVANRMLISELPVYNPGVFSLVESIESNSQDIESFYELEYINNVSTRFNLQILSRTVLRRVLYGICK